jgi:hypothetical protein
MIEEEEARLLERERRLAAVGSLLEFAESWKEDELCARFRVISGSLFVETPEFRLACVLVEAPEPLQLSEIAIKCGVSRDLVLREGRVRRAIERMEKAGLVLNVGREGRPRYCVDQSNSAAQILGKAYSRRRQPQEMEARNDPPPADDFAFWSRFP